MWGGGGPFFCEIRAGARISRGVRIFCYTGLEFACTVGNFFFCPYQWNVIDLNVARNYTQNIEIW